MPILPLIGNIVIWTGITAWSAGCVLLVKNEFKKQAIIEIDMETAIQRLEAAKREHLRSVK